MSISIRRIQYIHIVYTYCHCQVKILYHNSSLFMSHVFGVKFLRGSCWEVLLCWHSLLQVCSVSTPSCTGAEIERLITCSGTVTCINTYVPRPKHGLFSHRTWSSTLIRIPNMAWMTITHMRCFDHGTYKSIISVNLVRTKSGKWQPINDFQSGQWR
jgi:hypothetical protein